MVRAKLSLLAVQSVLNAKRLYWFNWVIQWPLRPGLGLGPFAARFWGGLLRWDSSGRLGFLDLLIFNLPLVCWNFLLGGFDGRVLLGSPSGGSLASWALLLRVDLLRLFLLGSLLVGCATTALCFWLSSRTCPFCGHWALLSRVFRFRGNGWTLALAKSALVTLGFCLFRCWLVLRRLERSLELLVLLGLSHNDVRLWLWVIGLRVH